MMELLQRGEFWALMAAVFWSLAVVLFKKTGERVRPIALNLFKSVLALVCLLPVVFFREQDELFRLSTREVGIFIASGFIGITLTDTLFFAALNRLGAGLNAVVDCLYWPSMILLAAAFLGEELPAAALLGGTLVIGGILVGSRSTPVPGRTRRDVMIGVTLGVLSMILLATSVVMMKTILLPSRIFTATTIRLAAATLFLLPALFARKEREAIAAVFRPSALWKLAVPSCLLGGVFAMVSWIAGLTLTTISRAAILNQLSTIFVFVLSFLVLKEPLTRRRVSAVVIAFAGTLLVIWATKR